MKAFISYLEDNNKKVSGDFEIIEESINYIKFKSGTNEITMPWNRILKKKEKLKGGKL